jgi:glycosyltransferase involved in cell wall biosynthesis
MSLASRELLNNGISDIPPVPEGVARPFWSVMIPTFNCARFLHTTLESVLQQDYPPEAMQIEVVDDCSDHDDPERVVQEVGQGRVGFFRQARNLGHTGNLLTCLRRSRGQAIHVLHGDDYVRPGFYARMGQVLDSNPSVGAAFCRHIIADEDGQWMSISSLVRDEGGLWTNGARELARKQRIQTPSVVVRRSVYERLGGFDARLSWTEDWEMWVRVAAHYPIWYDPEPLAVYRIREGSNTSRLMLTGENIRDVRRCIDIFKSYFPQDERSEIATTSRQAYAQSAIATASQLFIRGRQKGAFLQLGEALKCSCRLQIIKDAVRAVVVGQIRRAVYSYKKFRPWLVRRSQS